MRIDSHIDKPRSSFVNMTNDNY